VSRIIRDAFSHAADGIDRGERYRDDRRAGGEGETGRVGVTQDLHL